MTIDELPTENLPPRRRFEDLSLLELLTRLILSPATTLANLAQTLSPAQSEMSEMIDSPATVPIYGETMAADRGDWTFPALTMPTLDWRAMAPLLAMIGILLIGLGGSIMLFSKRMDNEGLLILPLGWYILLFAGGLMAILASITLGLAPYPRLAAEETSSTPRIWQIEAFLSVYGLRVAFFILAVAFTLGAWWLNTAPSTDPSSPADVVFTNSGVFCWLFSIFLWWAFFSGSILKWPSAISQATTNFFAGIRKPINIKPSWTLLIMVVILLVGAYFRFTSLSTYPPDMTSDHVEKALDSYHIFADNYRPVFLPNNGGRESFHFYFLALLEATTGHPMDFNLLKIATGIWGMIEILLAFWAGRAIFGEENPAFGNLVGLSMAAMVAISYWAIMLSRLGLRIVTTTLVVTVLLVFLIRALRHNRRIDYIMAGLTLGWGMYCYQSCRLLPLLVIAGIPIFLALRCRSWATLRKFTVNFIALVIMSLAVFVPLGHYAINFPGYFWSRATGRLVGYDTYTGVPIGIGDFLNRLKVTILGGPPAPDGTTNPGLAYTEEKSLLMFNFRGDAEWFTGTPNDSAPELDVFAGALFILGIGILIARMIRRRDVADWILLVAIPITVLPSALAVAFANQEVPSSTRASGALPVAYLIAALALAVIVWEIYQRVPVAILRYALLAGIVILFIFAADANANTYFVDAMQVYRQSTLPHAQMGQMTRDFANTIGSLNNTFIMGYPYWVDKRAVGIEAGDPNWQNGIDEGNPPSPDRSIELSSLVHFIAGSVGGSYEFQPDRYMMIFVNKDDQPMLKALATLLPNGWIEHVPVTNPLGVAEYADKDFYVFIAPPTGCNWWVQNIDPNHLPALCAAPNTSLSSYPASTLVPGGTVTPTPTLTPMPTVTPVPAQ